MRSKFHILQTDAMAVNGRAKAIGSLDALGLLACAPDSDYEVLVKDLNNGSVPFIGGTSLADPFVVADVPFGTTKTCIARRHIRCAVELSSPLTQEFDEKQVGLLYRKCMEKLDDSPKLLLVILPVLTNVFIDSILDALFELAGDAPVFGGLVSDDFSFASAAVFADCQPHRDRMVLAAFAGDVRPKTAVSFRVATPAMYSPRISRSKGSVIERVDGMTFCEYLGKVGYTAEELTDMPLSISMRFPETEPPFHTEINSLLRLDPATGSGFFIRNAPEGAVISVCHLGENDVRLSTSACLTELLAAMAEEEGTGYAFSTVLGASCVSRYYAMLGGTRTEAELMAAGLPSHLNTFGFYSFGEVCPVRDGKGVAVNRSHGHALALCAI